MLHDIGINKLILKQECTGRGTSLDATIWVGGCRHTTAGIEVRIHKDTGLSGPDYVHAVSWLALGDHHSFWGKTVVLQA
jgi:hypothetical protein